MKPIRLVFAAVALAFTAACSSSITSPTPDRAAPPQPGTPVYGIGTYGSGG